MTDETPWSVTELLRRMDAGRQRVDERLALLDEQGLDEQARGGWTRRQMLQHLITWHHLTIERLRSYRASGRPQVLERHEDDINAEAAAAARDRSREELLVEFRASYDALREEVAALTDDQLTEHDTWPGGIVVGNTFGHYEEHRPDLEPVPAGS